MNRRLQGCTAAIILLLGGLLLAPQAHATTRYGWGTITAVQFEEDPKARGKARWPHFRVLIECGNQISAREWTEQLVPIHGVGRHGPTVYVLDGKLSTPEEALKVGRLVNIMGDQHMAVSSTVPGPEARPGTREPANAIYLFRAGSIWTPAEVYDGRTKKWVARDKEELRVSLVVDVADGQVQDAFALAAWGHGGAKRPSCPVDASGLKVADGRITGEVTVRYAPLAGKRRLPDGKEFLERTFTIDAKADDAGAIMGPGDTSRPIGRLLNRPEAMPTAGQLWIRFADIPQGRDVGFAVAPLEDGALGPCSVMYSKGLPLSVFEDGILADDGNAITAKLTGQLKIWGNEKPCTIELRARRFGNRMLVGDYTLTWGELVIEDRLRGGIEPPGAPPLVNLDPSILAVTKPAIEAWKAKRKAQKK